MLNSCEICLHFSMHCSKLYSSTNIYITPMYITKCYFTTTFSYNVPFAFTCTQNVIFCKGILISLPYVPEHTFPAVACTMCYIPCASVKTCSFCLALVAWKRVNMSQVPNVYDQLVYIFPLSSVIPFCTT